MRSMLSPEIEEFLYYLKDRGVLKGASLIFDEGRAGKSGQGEFNPKAKHIYVDAADEYSGDFAAMHEAVHSLLKSDLKSKTRAYKEMYEKLPFMYRWKGVTTPKHWTQGMVDNPLVGGVEGKYNVPPEMAKSGMFWNPVNQYAYPTAMRMANAVRESIPPGRAWSGITSKTPDYARGLPEESTAHYLTNPEVNESIENRMTQLGMFLYDYGIPDEVVDKVLGKLKSYGKTPDTEPGIARRWKVSERKAGR